MIRINLLGVPKPRKGKGKRASAPSFSVPSEGLGIFAIVFVVLLLTGAANGLWYWQMKRQSAKLDEQISNTEVEYQRLALVKQKYAEREKERNLYQSRVDVIDKLRKDQSGPVTLLTTVGGTVDRTDGVWLIGMTDDGANINLKGSALSVHAIADLIRNLSKTGYFRTVEIKECFQDDSVKDMQSFQFTLQCQKELASPAPANKT
jgi:type IV pilus assembly protein PilN